MLEYINEILTRDENPIKIRFTSPGKKEKLKEVEKMDKVLARMEKLLKKQTAQLSSRLTSSFLIPSTRENINACRCSLE